MLWSELDVRLHSFSRAAAKSWNTATSLHSKTGNHCRQSGVRYWETFKINMWVIHLSTRFSKHQDSLERLRYQVYTKISTSVSSVLRQHRASKVPGISVFDARVSQWRISQLSSDIWVTATVRARQVVGAKDRWLELEFSYNTRYYHIGAKQRQPNCISLQGWKNRQDHGGLAKCTGEVKAC